MSSSLLIHPVGQFDLTQSIGFGFGQRSSSADVVMRLAFVLDDYEQSVGVAVRQRADNSLQLTFTGATDQEVASAQVARVLSVDVDSTGYDALGATDPLVGAAQRARPGLRPPLFYSAYEAACWAVLSARRPAQVMAAVRDQLGARHGAQVEVDGVTLPVLPTPRQLLAVESFPGLSTQKIERLHGIARAALSGDLNTTALKAMPAELAMDRLQSLAGIGPFYTQLIVLRALGHTDVLPTLEPKLMATLGRLTGADRPLTQPELAERAESWRPWRTWVCVALRATGGELLAD